MSIKVMTRVWEFSQAAGTDLLVLLALADNANDEGECWPSIRYVAAKCRIDTRTTQRRIRSLELLGEVVVIRGGGKASTAGGTKSNRYRIVVHIPDEEGGGDLPGCGTDARDGVAPVPPEPSLEPSVNRQSLAPATADAGMRFAQVRDALCDAFGLEWSNMTTREQGKNAKAIGELLAIGVDPTEIRGAVDRYKARHPDPKAHTFTGISGNWSAISTPTPTAGHSNSGAQRRDIARTVANWTTDCEVASGHIEDLAGPDDDRLAIFDEWERLTALARIAEPV